MTRCYLNIAIISFALLLRILIGIHPHSGQDDYQGPNNTPANSNIKYGGDYEAQRHWMELTYHLPINEWYYHDLQYWGLDYPPLTAYVSWMFGFVAHHVGSFHDNKFIIIEEENDEVIIEDICQLEDQTCIEDQESVNTKERRYSKGLVVLKDLVALHTSRWGFEDSRGKLYMRFTVLISDLLVYISAVWVIVERLTKQKEYASDINRDDIIPVYQRPRLWLLLSALSQPAIILIDHGHFQYNTISLGLALWSFHFISSSTNEFGPIVGSILFSLALNFKQMELYHALAVFAYLLGRCFRHANRYTHIIANFIALGVTVILTFAILWLPFVMSPPSDATSNLDGVLQIIKRVFPFQRGLFEGKVANIWCALSIKPFSIRSRIPENLLPLAALGLTLILILPPCWMLFKVGRGDNKQPNDGSDIRLLLWGTASTSLAFFLASFQVHEKGILIPLSSISLLMLEAPDFVHFFSILATWSLWPLLVIDRLTDAYICCLGIFVCINSMVKVPESQLTSYNDKLDIFSKRYFTRYVPSLEWIVMIILHTSELAVAPPPHLPDLYPVLWSFVGCGLFCLSYLATVWAMYAQIIPSEKVKKVKKKAKSKTSSFPPISLLGLVLLSSYTNTSDAFIQHNNIHTSYTHSIHASGEKDAVPSLFTDDLLERARRPLSWEQQVAKEAKPVLNLSAVRNLDTLSLADGADMDAITSSVEEETEAETEEETEYWIDGHVWHSTEQYLIDIGIMETEKILSSAPQLLRLPTQQVVEAANFLHSYPTGTNSTDLITADPSLLTYLADDLRYGLEEYLPNMMFMGKRDTAAQTISTQFSLSPSLGLKLIRMGVDGGLEERHISTALNNAGTASSKATEGIVGEVGKSFKQLQRIKGRKG